MSGKGKPRFRLPADLIAEIDSLAPLHGGRDAVVRHALACLRAADAAARLESAVSEISEAALELRDAVANLREVAERLDAVSSRLEGMPGGFGAASARPAEPKPGTAAVVREMLKAFEAMQGARLREDGPAAED